jgi:5-methylcytosine-specific restriction endonuclease McrA
MKKALLLNADYTPLHFISDSRAFSLVYKGRAEVLDMGGKLSVWDDEYFRTPSMTFGIPATVRLLSRVSRKWSPPRFRKKAIFNRDSWQCQYCQTLLHRSSVTIDHVYPRSRGGSNSWKNCVTSCKSCNRKKGSKTPAEAGMSLLKQPIEPSPFHFWDLAKGNIWHDDWTTFISRSV